MPSGNTERSVGASVSAATPSAWPTLNGNFHLARTDKPPDDRSILWKGKETATNTVSMSVGRPSGATKMAKSLNSD